MTFGYSMGSSLIIILLIVVAVLAYMLMKKKDQCKIRNTSTAYDTSNANCCSKAYSSYINNKTSITYEIRLGLIFIEIRASE